MLTVIHLRAPNDPNGNPRRIYLVLRGDEVLHAIDEGYSGIQAFRELYPNHADTQLACEIEIPASEYKAWRRDTHFTYS